MTHQYRIYGASDDLIEIGGHETEEFMANLNEPTFVVLGETTLRVEHDMEGIWRIAIDEMGPEDEVTRFGREHPYIESEYNDYTELVVVNTGVERVGMVGDDE